MEGGEQGDGASSASGGSSLLQFKRNLQQNMSPRSPLSPQSPDCDSIDLAMDDTMVDNNIDHLYSNIYEMASSDMSPSMRSFTTCGNESRIDAELRHLVGAETDNDDDDDDDPNDKPEMLKDVVVVTKGVKSSSSASPRSSPSLDKERKVATPNKRIGLAAKKGLPVRAMSLPRRVVSNGGSEKDKPGLERRHTIRERPPIARKANSVKGPMKAIRSASPPKEEKSSSSEEADHPDLGPYLLKKARDVISHGDNPKKAFELVLRAKSSFEKFSADQDKKLNLEYVMCLHILASMHCSSEEYEAAVPLLERSIEMIQDVVAEQSHALAKFAGCMQLGDVYAVMGKVDSSISLYKAGLEIQRGALGDKDARFGETCRYVAQAYVQALQFDEAEKLCKMALDTHKEAGSAISIEEAADRRLLGLIYDSKGNHEAALQHYSLASMAMSSNNAQETDSAAIDCNIGDAYLALARYDEAVISYQKALSVFKSSKGESNPAVASVFVRLAELHYKVGKFGESKSYCDNALRIYSKPSPGSSLEEIASGFIELAAIYESMNELEMCLKLLQKALKIHNEKLQGTNQQSLIAGLESQMGVIHYLLGNYTDSYNSLKSAIPKLQGCGDKSSLQGFAMNQLGITCLQLCAITDAAGFFEEARGLLQREYGPCHPDTLGVCSNLAATYDVLGRWDDAIDLLEFVVEMREEKLGTADPVVDDEKRRLEDMLKESGRRRSKKTRSLEFLLDNNSEIRASSG